MAITVEGADGAQWRVRRGVLHGKDGHGRRLRWRGPRPDWWDAIQLGEFAELPVIGWVFMVITLVIIAALVAVFLPFIVLGLLEILVVAIFATAAALSATLFGRPLVVRAESADGRSVAWGVTGWRASRDARDRLVESIAAGFDPAAALAGEPGAVLLAER
ncbi:MAG: hypothetical protein ACXIVQ_16210 [Acidimicrobiales bacterium]